MSDESTNIINNTVYINDEVIPFGAYQAIFHKLTKKVDRIRRIFNGGYTINPDDIINLHMCVMQSLQQYNIQGSQVEITHVEKKQGSRTFNSIDMFRCANITSREQTSSIAYSIDFLIVLPAQIEQSKDIAQRYKLTIIIDKDEVDDNDTSVPFFLRGYIGTPDIKMSLEYSDYMVAQALNSTVSGWINSLPKQKESKCLLNLKKIEGKVRGFLPI
ncbi:hypothetical protein ATPR_2649 [Acetobacter tropicalis NBRC 101654]|uniref:Uncharacterized protein n=1 Tax=Acetobacter tropicalis NBRC 101654 TaxID=749388 RepID=F7VH00_9PROT|nr:hypothetical protein [Acetobacter tropicalis]GAA09645.1 hypothetical protein ATPR_2649 [Acetobacter tropicalis NBRC 101654]